mmetsp:Transcript_9781/g.29875  ORF Transcript_9781/g.29875 Transcript_9781/m.29875 type:complete len:206 (+) Transcript_9781:570-1187(+)
MSESRSSSLRTTDVFLTSSECRVPRPPSSSNATCSGQKSPSSSSDGLTPSRSAWSAHAMAQVARQSTWRWWRSCTSTFTCVVSPLHDFVGMRPRAIGPTTCSRSRTCVTRRTRKFTASVGLHRVERNDPSSGLSHARTRRSFATRCPLTASKTSALTTTSSTLTSPNVQLHRQQTRRREKDTYSSRWTAPLWWPHRRRRLPRPRR